MPAVLKPNRGLYLGRPVIDIPEGGLSDGQNFSIDQGALNNLNLGAEDFGVALGVNVNGTTDTEPVLLIDTFFDRDSTQTLIFGGDKNIFRYNDVGPALVLMTPTYATATVDVSAANPAVVTDAAGGATPAWITNGIKAGDYIHFGNAAQTDPTALWYQVASVDLETQLTLTTAVAGGAQSNVAYTILKTFTGDLDNPWESVAFLHEVDGDEDWWIVTNGVDNIHKWNGTGNLTTLTTSFKAFHLTVFKNMLICTATVDTGEFLPAQMRNSDVGDPDDFTNGLASTFTVHEGHDEVNAATQLGDTLVLTAGRHIIMADFVGDPLVFTFRTAVPGLGPVSGRLVADFGDYLYYIGPDAMYTFDGVTNDDIGNHVWRDVIRRRDPQRSNRGFAHFDEENGRLFWAVPLTTDSAGTGPEMAYVEHYLEETPDGALVFSERSFPYTASGFFERTTALTWDELSGTWEETSYRWNDSFFEAAFPFNLVGNNSGEIFTLNTSQTQDGTALVSYVRTGRRPVSDGRARSLITRVYPFVSQLAANSAFQVRLRMADHALGDVTTTDEQIMDLALGDGDRTHFTTHYRRGRFMELEFRQDNGDTWEVAGWDFDGRPGGRR